MSEARDQERRREQQQFGANRRIVARDRAFLERQASELAQEPTAQGPRTVVLAADGERRRGHVVPRSRRAAYAARALKAGTPAGYPHPLEHDPEKWVPVFGKDHTP